MTHKQGASIIVSRPHGVGQSPTYSSMRVKATPGRTAARAEARGSSLGGNLAPPY